jgi:thiol-disulfide isomerase/thioredoxin
MIEQPKYFDIRSDFWKASFDQGEPYDDYLANSPQDKADPWREKARQIPALDAAEAQRLSGFNRTLNVLCVSGVWCGDCVRQGPMLKAIADAAGATLRVIDRDVNIDLRDEVRILGAMRVPVVVFLTEDFHEVGRFGDRLLTVYRRKAENEIGAACAVPYANTPEDQLKAEQSEWVDVFERMLIMTRLCPPLRQKYGD